MCGDPTEYYLGDEDMTTWKHWVSVKDGNTWRWYLNGELREKRSNFQHQLSAVFALVWRHFWSNFPPNEELLGSMDDIGIWNKPLSESEVLALYTGMASEGCTDTTACTFDPEATSDDGSCLYLDECGSAAVLAPFMNGRTEIPQGDCDCEGNQFDALGVCGGECLLDEDFDGICDDGRLRRIHRCMRDLQRSWRHLRMRLRGHPGRGLRLWGTSMTNAACAMGQGPFTSGCADIPEGDCDVRGTKSTP